MQNALNLLDEGDREIIVLRHFEELTNSEVAAVLELISVQRTGGRAG